jgi:uncharacterized short protein YbdD (DUF466 family)
MKTQWQDFRKSDFNKLMVFVADYANLMEDSRKADFKKWQRGKEDFNTEREDLRNWLEMRAKYMDDLVAEY